MDRESTSYWRWLSHELFFSEFEDPKKFYETFTEPVMLYQELAQRVCALAFDSPSSGGDNGEFTYKLMYTCYMQDAKDNDPGQLRELAAIYRDLTNPVQREA